MPADIPPMPVGTPGRTGVLLLQLGTPDSTAVRDVRQYLREFLSDPRVLDLPAPARLLLLNAVILPFRPRRSAEAYHKIWTEQGSPLTLHTEALAVGLQQRLGDTHRVAFAMRYRNPSIASAVDDLAACSRIVVVPLFPQYASAAGGSAVQRALEVIGERWNVPEVVALGDFYDDPGFIAAVAAVAQPRLSGFRPDHILFSYHGLPERQVRKSDPTRSWCLAAAGCCDEIGPANRFCYRAQCHATTRALATALDLAAGTYTTAFQSRLAGQKWIEPYTDHTLSALAASGVRRLAVLTPSFTADCLETLEEIGIRGRHQWERADGEDLLLVPCVNASAPWVEAVADMVRRAG